MSKICIIKEKYLMLVVVFSKTKQNIGLYLVLWFTRLFYEKIANVLCTLMPVCICCLRACLPDTLINHGDQVFRMNEIG